jgi:hypothetical protein
VEEGIFIFNSERRCFTMPVDEDEYLEFHAFDDVQRGKRKEARLKAEETGIRKTDTIAELRRSTTMQNKEVLTALADKDGDNWKYARLIVVYDARSLFMFHHRTCLRRFVVGMVNNKIFDNFILILIAANTLVLLMTDYHDPDNECTWNKNLELLGMVFSWCFIVECALKIVALGFIFHQNAYLKDSWNWLDFIVVIIGIIELSLPEGGINLKALRAFRVLRPLRSINSFPSMKRYIRALANAIPSML